MRQKVQAGRHIVWTVYESCGFGYTLHYQLVEAGAFGVVISPVRLHPERRRKNDRLDSRKLCLRLSRYLEGQKDELPVIRIPTVAEQQRRELVKTRQFWNKLVRQLEKHGRALRLEHEDLKPCPMRLGADLANGKGWQPSSRNFYERIWKRCAHRSSRPEHSWRN